MISARQIWYGLIGVYPHLMQYLLVLIYHKFHIVMHSIDTYYMSSSVIN